MIKKKVIVVFTMIPNFCSYFIGSEEFLVDVIVLRCKLFYQTGNLPKVIAILQALVEFHFFAPVVDFDRKRSFF